MRSRQQHYHLQDSQQDSARPVPLGLPGARPSLRGREAELLNLKIDDLADLDVPTPVRSTGAPPAKKKATASPAKTTARRVTRLQTAKS